MSTGKDYFLRFFFDFAFLLGFDLGFDFIFLSPRPCRVVMLAFEFYRYFYFLPSHVICFTNYQTQLSSR